MHGGQVMKTFHQLLKKLAFICISAAFVSYTINKARTLHGLEPEISIYNREPLDSFTNNTALGFKWVPFTDVSTANPKLVVLLSYQRSGSTFVSELFNKNKNIFSQFEPLDSLYSSLYGTKCGWNVPSDITHYRNGSLRQLPKWEIDEVSSFLQRLLTCDINSLPTITLIHPYQFSFKSEFLSTSNYIRCLKRNVRGVDCHPPISMSDFCGGRFGEMSEERLGDCRKLLLNSDDTSVNVSSDIRAIFSQRRNYLNSVQQMVNWRCAADLQRSCQQRSIRAVKVVRATMHSMEKLLSSMENLRVIHLIRDPRAVSLSRYRLHSSVRGLYSISKNETEAMIREAWMYCRTVVDDVRERRILEARFPGRILSVVYDDMVTDYRRYVRQIYRFLDLPLNGVEVGYEALRVVAGAVQLVNATAPAMQIAGKWRTELSFEMRLSMLEACKDFFQLNEYEWKV